MRDDQLSGSPGGGGPDHAPSGNGATAWLAGGGEMGERIRRLDWSATALGPTDTWPQSLRSAISILLPSKAQICLFWGPELIKLYNDAYIPVLGRKHPGVLGRPGREVWSEIWDVLGPLLHGVIATGEAFRASDHPFYLERHGFAEETYFDVSYDPVRDETGKVGGVFCIVSETTGRVLSERRLRTLRDLGARQGGPVGGGGVRAGARRARGQPAGRPVREPVPARRRGRAAPRRWRRRRSRRRRADPAGRSRSTTRGGRSARSRRERPAARGPHRRPPPRAACPRTPPPTGRWSTRSCAAAQCAGFMIAGTEPLRRARGRLPRLLRSRGRADRHGGRARRVLRGGAAARRGAGRAGPRQDDVLQQRQPRVPDAADADARARSRTCSRRRAGALAPDDRETLAVIHRNGLRLLKLVNTLLDFSRIEAGRHEARVRADRSRRVHRGAGGRLPLRDRARPDSRSRCDCPGRPRAGLRRPRHVGEDRPQPALQRVQVHVRGRDRASSSPSADRRRRAGRARHRHRHRAERDRPRLRSLPPGAERARRARTRARASGWRWCRSSCACTAATCASRASSAGARTFTVTLPRGRAHLPADRVAPRRTAPATASSSAPRPSSRRRWAGCPTPTRRRAVDTATVPIARARGARPPASAILVADDNADMREYVARLLGARWDVEAVADGRAALAALARAARRSRPGRRDDAGPRRLRAARARCAPTRARATCRSSCCPRAPARSRASRGSRPAPTTT